MNETFIVWTIYISTADIELLSHIFQPLGPSFLIYTEKMYHSDTLVLEKSINLCSVIMNEDE